MEPWPALWLPGQETKRRRSGLLAIPLTEGGDKRLCNILDPSPSLSPVLFSVQMDRADSWKLRSPLLLWHTLVRGCRAGS